MDLAEHVPVAQGLFQGEGTAARLIGTRCASCGTHYFPRSLSCRNPTCSDKQIADVLLSPCGTLYSYTVQSYRPPPLFRMEPWAPYALGLVELSEGLRVMGMLSNCALTDIRIGMTVQLALAPLYRNEQGQHVMTYTFQPAVDGGAS